MVDILVTGFELVWAVYFIFCLMSAANYHTRGRDGQAIKEVIWGAIAVPYMVFVKPVLYLAAYSLNAHIATWNTLTQGADYRNFWGYPLDVPWHANDTSVPQTACRSLDYLYR